MPTRNTRPVVLVVLDGWGSREETLHNPIAEARTPFFDELWRTYPHSLLDASGMEVGLPEGQMGNSEIGHMVIGSGMPIPSDLVRIRTAMDRGEFETNPVLQHIFQHTQTHQSTLHLLGLLGFGGVHAHQDHLVGILKAAKRAHVSRVLIHGFTDGRDTPPQSAADSLADLETKVREVGVGTISTLCGRFYAMDRDKHWDRIEKAEAALFEERGRIVTDPPSRVMRSLYKQDEKDEQLEPLIFSAQDGTSTSIHEGDAVFFFNFRADRAVQLSRRILERCVGNNVAFATMTKYADDLDVPAAFPSFIPPVTLAEEVSKAGLTQAHIAETEKYAHATYFLNGGREKPHPREEHVLLESRKDVLTHDLAPEMRAEGITDAAIGRLERGINFVFINYANADMVGHTANHAATLLAIETLDKELARLWKAIEILGGVLCITADHGNAEISHDHERSQPHTAHTTNPVPFILTSKNVTLLPRGTLADVAPTVLKLLGLPVPPEMKGMPLTNGSVPDQV